MLDSFPKTPRPPLTVGLTATAIALVGLALATRVTITSWQWVGRVFPGFVLMDNRVVGLINLAHWPGTSVPPLYLSELQAVDGEPITSTREAYAKVAVMPPGTEVRYRLRRGGVERDVVLPAQRFGTADWLLLFGPFLLNGVVYLGFGVGIWLIRPRDPLGQACLVSMGTCGIMLLTLADLYGPGVFSRIYLTAEALLPAAALQVLPLTAQHRRHPRWRFAAYLPSAVIIGLYHFFFHRPPVYAGILLANLLYLGIVAVAFVVHAARANWHPSQMVRQRARVLTLGATLVGGPIAAILVYSVLESGGVAVNGAMLLASLLPPLAAYSLLKQDILEIGELARRSVYYVLITVAVTGACVVAVMALNFVLQARVAADSAAFPLLSTLIVLLLFDPLRRGVRGFVDRAFFGSPYEGAQMLAKTGTALVTALTREHIARLLQSSVDEAIPNTQSRVFLDGPAGGRREMADRQSLPPALKDALASGRIVTSVDPPVLYRDPCSHEAAVAALADLGAEVAVPITVGREFAGAVTVGHKRSGRYYTARDADFLSALTRQAAIALQNARSYEALAELNARLEERVRERTAQVEETNREIAAAYTALVAANARLAGLNRELELYTRAVSHDVRSPVAAAAEALHLLRDAPDTERQRLAALAAENVRRADGMLVGLRDLMQSAGTPEPIRPVATRALVDQVIDEVRSARGAPDLPIALVGTFADVEGQPRKLAHVFRNLIDNAVTHTRGRPDPSIEVGQEARGDDALFWVRDHGPGVPYQYQAAIFEPFRRGPTAAGDGTGLGLALVRQIVEQHGGRVWVESEPGAGATFWVQLPRSAGS